jgi:aerobic carbon-monoxide dehydrogenase small subunit
LFKEASNIKMNRTAPDSTQKRGLNLIVNGKRYRFKIGDQPGEISASQTLAETLREKLGLTGTKVACNHGGCGSCTVIMNGQAILSCTTLTVECAGKSITTIEGLADPKTGRLHPLQQAFMDHTAFQCGFCTPGIIMSAKALLDQKPLPTKQEIKQALAGHYCRCISHYLVVQSVLAAAKLSSRRG